MAGHVEVEDLAASMLHHEEAVEQLEGHRRHGEEVEGDDHLAVILEKGKPPLTWAATAPNSSRMPNYTPFGDFETGFLKFSMDLGSTQAGIASSPRNWINR